jgi:hypothetical protein
MAKPVYVGWIRQSFTNRGWQRFCSAFTEQECWSYLKRQGYSPSPAYCSAIVLPEKDVPWDNLRCGSPDDFSLES